MPIGLPLNGRITLLTIVLCLLLSSHGSTQHYSKADGELILEVQEIMAEHHIDYYSIQPLVKQRVPGLLLRQLDPQARYLTRLDEEKILNAFPGMEYGLDNNLAYLEVVRSVIEHRLARTDSILSTLRAFDFFIEDSLYVARGSDSLTFVASDAQLRQLWTRHLKYQVLRKFQGDSTLMASGVPEVNRVLNERIVYEKESERCKLQALLDDQEELSKWIITCFLKAYCQSFDPHSNFHTIELANIFLTALSSERYSTGIVYDRRGSDFIVAEIDPLSEASRFSEIEVGDEITGLVIDGSLVSLSCISAGDLISFFYGEEQSHLEIELRSKRDGLYRRFVLAKGTVYSNANHVFSYILKEDDLHIGYVEFPSFYSSSILGGRSSAEDLALALLELKRRNVDDVIIDLRNNGGGSVEEASDLLGYFVDYGPLFTLVRPDRVDGVLEKDTKRGKVVEGKTIFLVNALSASASEIVASTMQSYPDNLVIGSPTYGKATAQRILPVYTPGSLASLGGMAVTTMRVYRYDGTHYQGSGVIPDITLPTIWNRTLASELDEHYVLEHTSSRSFRPVKLREEPIDSLRALVEERNSLAKLDSISEVVSSHIAAGRYVSLNFSEDQGNIYFDPDTFQSSVDLEIEALETNEAFIDESTRRRNQRKNDAILYEVFQIFEDWKFLSTK